MKSKHLLLALAVVPLLYGCTPGSPGDTGPAPTADAALPGGRGGSTGGSGGSSSAGSGGSGVAGTGGATAGSGATGGTAGAAGAAGGGGSGTDPSAGSGGAGGSAATDAAPTGSDAAPPAGGMLGDGFSQVMVRSAVGLGYFTSCHVLPDGGLRCFGDRHPRTMPPGGIKTKQITCAHDGCCVLLPAGSDTRIRCWSDKTTIIPPAALARSVDPIQIAIGYQQGCALNADHTLACWGQPGTVYQPPAGLKAKLIYHAAYWVCAITMEDDVTCWGINPPPPPAGLKAKLVSGIFHGGGHLGAEARMGTRHACAIKLDDTVVCWGDNIDGTTDVPPNLGPVRDVGTSTYSSCAVKPEGDIVCWGTRKMFDDPARYKPQPPNLKLKAIKGQFGAYCAVQLDDTLVCWGDEKTSHITVPAGMKVFMP